MKYEFHVGDYVEMNDGRVGYIGGIGKNEDKCYIIWNSDFVKVGIGHSFDELIKGAIRIGQYDFTKKDDGKIESLGYNGSPDWDDYLLLDKINELVDAVNELRKGKNE